MIEKLRVGIIYGGRSAEHDISLLSARNVLAALDPDRYEPVLIGIDRDGAWLLQEPSALLGGPRPGQQSAIQGTAEVRLAPVSDQQVPLIISGGASAAQGLDVIFPVLHGPMGEDGTVQGLLELTGIPYVGASVLGSAVGMDKDVMKRLLRDAGLKVAGFSVVRKRDLEMNLERVLSDARELGFPLYTKPANMGSSIGIRRVESINELRDALDHALQFDVKAIMEEAITGREIECGVIGSDEPIASIPGEIVVKTHDSFYSYETKYLDENGAEMRIPADLPPDTVSRLQHDAVRTFEALSCHGLARVDFFLTPSGDIYVNEINTLPGFTAYSMFPKLWEASGVSRSALVTRLIELAIERQNERASLTRTI